MRCLINEINSGWSILHTTECFDKWQCGDKHYVAASFHWYALPQMLSVYSKKQFGFFTVSTL